MLFEAILLHVFFDDLTVLLLSLFLRHAFELFPGSVLVLAHEVEEAGFGNIDVSDRCLFIVAVDFETLVGLQQHYPGFLGVVFEEVGRDQGLVERGHSFLLGICCH